MKIAAAQISCALGDLDANVRKVRDFAARAKGSGADLVLFPEMVDTGYSMPAIQKHARRWNEGAAPKLQHIAMQVSIGLIAGISDRERESIFNAQVFVSREGELLAKYRKTHLVTAAPLDERVCLSPGDKFVSYKIDPPHRGPAADDFNFGLSICYDLRFPEMCRTLTVMHGADVIVNSSAWPFVRMEHLRVLALARAIENQSYVVIANRVGTDDGVSFCGSSVIVDPYGAILAAASADREELIYAEISKEVIADVRKRISLFDHRRGELYRTN